MFEVIDLTGQTFFGLGTQFDPLLSCLPVGDAWNDWLQCPHGSDPVVVHRHGKYLVSSNTRPGVSQSDTGVPDRHTVLNRRALGVQMDTPDRFL